MLAAYRDSLKAGAIHLVMGTHSVATVQLLAAAYTQAKQNMVSAPVLAQARRRSSRTASDRGWWTE